MKISVIGINHKTAPIEVREKFFLNSIQQDLFLSEVKSNPAIAECFILSTCNRTEIYLRGINPQVYLESLVKLVVNIKKEEFHPECLKYFYVHEEAEAVRHLLKVTVGLDSLVLGERQIIGQVRTAVERGRLRGMFHQHFNILSNIAIRMAKKAQTETEIAFGGLSVSWAAIVQAERLLGSLQGKSILIIGAGKMGELTINQIKNRGVKNIYLMNRTGTTAQALAETCQGIAASFLEIKEILNEVDVCVCAASAPHYILDQKIVEKVMVLRNNRPLVLIDISMPRNIDPLAGKLKNVFLSHIDDLEQVAKENLRRRQLAVPRVEAIIEEKLSAFYQKLDKMQTV